MTNEHVEHEIQLLKKRLGRIPSEIESSRRDIEYAEGEIALLEDEEEGLTNKLSKLQDMLNMTDEEIEAKQQQDELDEIEARRQEDLIYARYHARHVASLRDYWQVQS